MACHSLFTASLHSYTDRFSPRFCQQDIHYYTASVLSSQPVYQTLDTVSKNPRSCLVFLPWFWFWFWLWPGLVVPLKNKKSLGGVGSRISLILVQTPGHPSIVRPRKRLVRRLVPSQS